MTPSPSQVLVLFVLLYKTRSYTRRQQKNALSLPRSVSTGELCRVMEVNLTNFSNTEAIDGDFFANGFSEAIDPEEIPIDHWLIIVYFALISIGATVNCVNVFALSRCKRNGKWIKCLNCLVNFNFLGALTVVMQIALVDILLLHVAVMEIITLNDNTWPFSANNCPLYKGGEILFNSLLIYFMIVLNLHVISLWNYSKWEAKRATGNPLTSCSTDDSNECLVTRNESSNRIVNIDYRKRKQDLSIIIPTILIWFLCLSISIPNYTLSSTLKFNETQILCAIFDSYYGQVLQYLLLVFRVLVPVPLFVFTFVLLAIVACKTRQTHVDNAAAKRFDEIRAMVRFATVLSAAFIVTSFQRYFIYFLHVVYDEQLDAESVVHFKLPPLYTNCISSNSSTYLAMLHYSSSSFRAILHICLLPKFRTLIKNKLLTCKT